jgi:hypothetical protein
MFFCQTGFCQDGWEWELLSNMPEPVANNAFTEAYRGDTLCYYSFTGIGSELTPESIHLKSWRYNSVLNQWQNLPDVDDFRGKIAAGASTIDSIIYLIGGYHVFENFSEQTSAKVHRFNAESNTWLDDGADIPFPVDDHVQAVWRDSLIYVVTGWSNNTNTASVQIYNPYLDEWTAATSVPPTSEYRAFGASGTIIGDTIYYFGGVHIAGFNFLANKRFRRGVINPADPTQISWEYLGDAPVEENGYRMACTHFENEAIWIGGAGIAYNFDALAYSNNQVVNPLGQIRTYDSFSGNWTTAQPSPHAIMDLRGIAREDEDSWIIAGGISNNREVSDQVWRITRATVGTVPISRAKVRIMNHKGRLDVEADEIILRAELYTVSGCSTLERMIYANQFTIQTNGINSGFYVMKLAFDSGEIQTFKLVILE